jgi:tetratricopeptide (TPR) repeat protein
LIQIAPQSSAGYLQLAIIRTQQKRWPDAENLLRQALSHDPNSTQIQEALVNLDFQRGQPAAAISRLQEQVHKNPNSAAMVYLLGQAQLRNSQDDEATKSFTRAVELAPANFAPVSALAVLQAKHGETDAAISSYKKAIALAPTNAQLVVSLGSLYETKGDWQQAQTTYQQALSIQGDNTFAANNLAYLLLEHGGDVNVALGLAQIARRGMSDSPNSADTLAWAYYNTGSYSAAAPLLEDAVKKAPNNPAYRYHLGRVYQKLNDPTRARANFEAAVKAKPDSPAAESARKALSEL